MLLRCWLGGRKGIRPVKNWVVGSGVIICLERCVDLHMAQLMPLPLTVSCSNKIQIGFAFLVPAHLVSPGQMAIKRVGVWDFRLTRSALMLIIWLVYLIWFLLYDKIHTKLHTQSLLYSTLLVVLWYFIGTHVMFITCTQLGIQDHSICWKCLTNALKTSLKKHITAWLQHQWCADNICSVWW